MPRDKGDISRYGLKRVQSAYTCVTRETEGGHSNRVDTEFL